MPRAREIRFFFGRLNLIGRHHPTVQEKKKFLLEAFTAEAVVERRGYRWIFLEAGEVEFGELGTFLHGYLGKYKAESEAEVVVEESHKIAYEQIQRLVSAKARFFLHVQSGLIAYHPVGREIDRRAFTDVFVRLFKEACKRFFVEAEISAVEDQYRILDEIKKFDIITSIEIKLHRANPRTAPKWEQVQARLDRLGVQTYSERFEAPRGPTEWDEGKVEEEGLNVASDRSIRQKISMADDGYGRAVVKGRQNGERKQVSTSDNPITAMPQMTAMNRRGCSCRSKWQCSACLNGSTDDRTGHFYLVGLHRRCGHRRRCIARAASPNPQCASP